MKIQIARLVTSENKEPQAPAPAYVLLGDGKPLVNLTADDLDQMGSEFHAEIKCPKCGHTIWHKVTDAFKAAAESVGNAIGESKFGG